MGHSLAGGHGGTQRFFREPPQQPATLTHTSSPGQSRFLSHSSVAGHISLLKSRHLLRPLTVTAHWHPGQAPQTEASSGHLLLLMAGLSSHCPCAPATPGNNESSPILPSRAAPLSLMAVPREMVPSASPLATSSKLSASLLFGKLSSLLVPSLCIVGPPSRLVQTLPGVFPL